MLKIEKIHSKNCKHSKPHLQYLRFVEQTYPFLEHNLTPFHFNNTSNIAFPFAFWLKGYSYPIIVKSCTYQVARLKLYRFIRKSPNLKHVTFYHDRLFTSVNASSK